MKVVLYMAISANGIIATDDDNTDWLSKEEWNSFSLAVRTAGCLIVGRTTYLYYLEMPEFSEFKDVKIIVVSQGDPEMLAANHFIAHSPKEALDLSKDYKEVIIGGGAILNASFLSEKLVDEIYLDIEPILFGTGIPLFRDKAFEQELRLIDQKKIGEDEIQLHYQVLK